MSDKDIGQKIKELREQHNLTLEEVGDAVGVGKSTVRKWETGIITEIGHIKIGALAKILKTTVAYLLGYDQVQEYTVPNLFKIETKKFPMLGNIACGEPIFANEDMAVYIEAGADIQADFCLRATGDSMIGARIHDGDIVFIRSQNAVNNGEIAVVLIDDEATLKRVYYDRENETLSLFAENPKYPTMRYCGEELNRIKILGKAVALQTDIL